MIKVFFSSKSSSVVLNKLNENTMYLIFRADSYSATMIIKSRFINRSQNPRHMAYCGPRADLNAGKIWCKSVHKFEIIGQKWDFVWMTHMIQIDNVAVLSSCQG